MDKKTIPLVVLCILLAVFWNPLVDWTWRALGWQKTPPPVAAQTTASPTSPTSPASSTPSPTSSTTPAPAPITQPMGGILKNLKPGKLKDGKTGVLENEKIQVCFNTLGGGIETITLKSFQEKNEGFVVLNHNSPIPLSSIATGPANLQSSYQITPSHRKLTAYFKSTDGLEITKEYTLNEDYLIDLKITAANRSSVPIYSPLQLTLGMATPMNKSDNGQYLGLSLFSGEKDFIQELLPSVQKFVEKQGKPYEHLAPIHWASVKNQYFSVIVTPQVPFNAVYAEPFALPESDIHQTGIIAVASAQPLQLDPGVSAQWSFQIYAGPKEYKKLLSLGKNQDEVLAFGSYLGIFSKGLLWLMEIFHRFFHNWGVAIILVTVTIKIIFWPLTAIGTRSMKQMQALAPKMNELKEKYKDDAKKMNEEMIKLYRDYNINPVMGCLPMLIQIPIFFAFYTLLTVAVELRGAPFVFWIHDLSAPDTVIKVLGFPINPLPIIMAGTMIWQTRITPQPPSADPSMKMMQWMMPAMFLFFCYNFSSGLSLYWTAQNLLTILQTYYTKDQPVEAPHKVKKTKSPKSGFTFMRPNDHH